jgi:hypothetical protein
MFGFKKERLVDEKYITDVNLELAKINRQIVELQSQHENLYDLFNSMKGRTNRKKIDETEETNVKNVMLPS